MENSVRLRVGIGVGEHSKGEKWNIGKGACSPQSILYPTSIDNFIYNVRSLMLLE